MMKGSRRFLGYASLALGAVSIVVGASPLFPIVVEAFVIGGAFLALGLWALSGSGVREALRRAARATASARKSARREARSAVSIDPLLPVRILRLAKDRGGTLTVADVAIGLDVPLDHAREGLEECVRAGNAMPDYDIPRAHALYRFPEFIAPEEHSLSSRE
jgi:hypothetical protein